MIRYELKNWWTFEEVLVKYGVTSPAPYNMHDSFYSSFHNNYPNAPLWDSGASKAHIEDLWKIVYARFYNYYCLSTDYDYDLDEDSQVLLQSETIPFIVKLLNVIVLTYPKYSTLLTAYASKANSLLSQISATTTGVARFNDTPQNEQANDEFANDDHVTNLTQTSGTSLTDGMTPIQRLKEIQDSYKSIMEDWANEFKILFIEENNISI